MHIHLLGRDVRLQRKILAKKQDGMHPHSIPVRGNSFEAMCCLTKTDISP